MSLKPLMQSRTRIRILTLLLLGREGRYYVREIQRRVGENINAVRRELSNLESAGLAKSEHIANLKYYQINSSSSIYPELRSLFLKTEGVAEVVKEKLAEHGFISKAFIFGSFAVGNVSSSSDIDLFIVGDIDEKIVLRSIREVESFLGREVNYVAMSAKEFEKRVKSGDPFVSRVLNSPVIPLIGEAPDAPRGTSEKRHGKAVRRESERDR